MIDAALAAGGLLAVGEAGQHRVDHRVQRQPAVDVQFRGEPDLGVHHVVGGQVFDALVGHPVQRLRRLHHPDGVRERLQVPLERSAVRGGPEERRQAVDIGGRQVLVAGLLGEVEDGGGAQSAVEVVVQQRLGRPPDRVEGQRARQVVIRSMISGPMSGAVSPTLQPPSISAIAPSKRSGVSV